MRIVFYTLIAFTIIYLFRSLFSGSAKKQKIGDISETEMVKDPNCKVYIEKSDAVKRYLKGSYYYFCSSKCAKEFKKKH